MNEPWKWNRNHSTEIADCRVFKIRKDFCTNSQTETEASFFVIECANWANIIPITDAGEVVLIEQYRQGIEEITLEIPGGMIDADEAPLDCAKRELLEETGFNAKEVIPLGKTRPNPAIQNNWMFHFVARGCEMSGKTNFDAEESIVTKLLPLEDIPGLIRTGNISHSLVVSAFYLLSNCEIDIS